jgi:SAM-dependent methyltransferase
LSPEQPAHGVATIPSRERRGCDVCGGTSTEALYDQRFVRFDDASGLDGYTVVACTRCGFMYADELPGQDVFDRYYRDLSKYESHDTEGDIVEWKAVIHRSIVADISERLPDRSLRILDVGSSSGHLISLFQKAGYRDAIGFDPSPRCRELARSLYGVEVINTSISQMAFGGERFDLILMASVLEHLRDLERTLSELRGLLRDGGAIWAEVPDAARFADYTSSPFQQFSLEHINFFTLPTLERLMHRVGFRTASTWPTIRQVGSMDDPGLDGLFVRAEAAPLTAVDAAGVAAARTYVDRSEELERRLCDRLEGLAASGEAVVVWGTGSLTLHLMNDPVFRRLNIAAFVDSNANYQGKTIRGIPILAPAALHGRDEPILIVSHAAEDEILAAIRDRYQLPNRVLRFLGEAA